MMGEMLDLEGPIPAQLAAKDRSWTIDAIPTDVDGVSANGKMDADGLPIFDVEKNEFFQNMEHGRRRLRFRSGSGLQKYMQGTKYRNPFYIRWKDDAGKEYVRKVK